MEKKIRKYKCPDCKKKEMEKKVYTEYRCLNPECDFVNHEPHRSKCKAKEKDWEEWEENKEIADLEIDS